MNSYFLLLYSYLIGILLAAKDERGCGYSGTKGKQMETDFDNCFQSEVKDSRLRMSIGYEKCFGFNYKKLNDTVAEPFNKKQRIANRELIDLSLKTCVVTEEQEKVEKRVVLDRKIDNCKHYFNVIIQAMYNDDELVGTYLDSQSALMKPLLNDRNAFTLLKNKIIKIITPIDDCKQPQSVFRIKLIKKYLEMFLNKVVSPLLPSFNDETLPIFEHPETIILRTHKVIKTNIEELLESKRKKGHLVPEKRTIVIKKRSDEDETSESEKKKSIVDKLLGFFKPKKSGDSDNEQTENQKNTRRGDIDDEQPQTVKNVNHPDSDIDQLIEDSERENNLNVEDLQSKDHEHESNTVVIDDFWDDNLEIKKKRLGNHDFDRYKIKGFDIDRQLKKLFKE